MLCRWFLAVLLLVLYNVHKGVCIVREEKFLRRCQVISFSIGTFAVRVQAIRIDWAFVVTTYRAIGIID